MTAQAGGPEGRETPTVPRGRPEHLFDLGPVRAESGRSLASMPTGPWLRGRDGRLSPAGLGVLMDDVLGQAILLGSPAGHWSVTTELSLDIAAPLPDDGQRVSATAAPVLLDEAGGLARGELRDAAGRCLAVGTTWSRFIAGIPDEVLRPPEVPAGIARGACLSDLLRVRLQDTGRIDLPARVELGNARGVVHGGVLLCLTVMAAEEALRDSGLEVASVRVAYLRPARGELAFAPAIIRQGRSLCLVRVEVADVAGVPCTTATIAARSSAGPLGRRP